MLNWLALMFALGPDILAVWVFNHLRQGGIIVPDNLNNLEFWLAYAIFLFLVIALTLQTRKTFKRGK